MSTQIRDWSCGGVSPTGFAALTIDFELILASVEQLGVSTWECSAFHEASLESCRWHVKQASLRALRIIAPCRTRALDKGALNMLALIGRGGRSDRVVRWGSLKYLSTWIKVLDCRIHLVVSPLALAGTLQSGDHLLCRKVLLVVPGLGGHPRMVFV